MDGLTISIFLHHKLLRHRPPTPDLTSSDTNDLASVASTFPPSISAKHAMTSPSQSDAAADAAADGLRCLHFLLRLIHARDWDRLHDIARSRPDALRRVSEDLPGRAEFNGMTLLHACARCDPPVDVLARLVEAYPEALRGGDCLGRTPLHVAAGTGARPSVLRLLVVGHPGACDARDEDGRTPLHLACDASCELFEDGGPPRDPPSLEAVEVLLSGSLKAATVEDIDEMNAVEYALMSGASMKVVRLLQRASQRVMLRAKVAKDKAMSADVPTQSRRVRWELPGSVH